MATASSSAAPAVDVDALKKPTRLLKFCRRDKPHFREFRLSDDGSSFLWHSSRKRSSKSCIALGQVQRVQAGMLTAKFERHRSRVSSGEDCAFSLVLNSGKTLDLVCESAQQRDLYMAALEHCIAEVKGASDADPEMAFIKSQWNAADDDKSGSLSFKEIWALLNRLNVATKRALAKTEFARFDADKSGELEFEEFIRYLRHLRSRPEVVAICNERGTASTADETALTAAEFAALLRDQGDDAADAEALCRRFDPLHKGALITPAGLARFLSSPDNEAFDPKRLQPYQDMSRPLSHYFIASSHNTYLEGDQLRSASSVNMYVEALTKGCRCVELDCWDGGDGEPEIYHGHTLTTRIKFADVIQAVHDFGFKTSPYPVILSLENHCSLEQQGRMASIMREKLGDMLPAPLDRNSPPAFMPSPEELKHKVLIKGKSLVPAGSGQPDESEDNEDDEDVEGEEGGEGKAKAPAKPADKPHHKVAPELSDLVWLKAVKCKSFAQSIEHALPWEMTSFSEPKTKKKLRKDPVGFVDYNKKQFSRIYPAGTRVDSSNYDPVPAWNAGCQIVALNYQTPDAAMQINDGRFRENGGVGYVLKPAVHNQPKRDAFNPVEGPFTADAKPWTVRVTVLSAQQLPKPGGATKGEVIDPYVVVELRGAAPDCARHVTRTIDDNGFSPIWEQGFEFSVRMPELAFLHFTVMDQDVGRDDFIGYYVVPVSNMRKGYRHCPLFSGKGARYEGSSLFCKIEIEGGSA